MSGQSFGFVGPVTFDQSFLPPLLLEAVSKEKVYTASGASVPLHSNVALCEALVLYNIVRELKPTVSAEIGFAQGISTLAILKALEDNGSGAHHVIDPFQDKFDDVGLTMVRRSGLTSRLSFHRKFA